MFYLLANGFYFGLTEAGWHTYRGWEITKVHLLTWEPMPGITVGYRWVFKKSLWFLDWNFFDMPYQRGFRVGAFVYERILACYGIINPVTVMLQSQPGEQYNLIASKQKALALTLGAGLSYKIFKNITMSLEYVFQINYTPVYSKHIIHEQVFFIRNRLVVGVEFHGAKRNE